MDIPNTDDMTSVLDQQNALAGAVAQTTTSVEAQLAASGDSDVNDTANQGGDEGGGDSNMGSWKIRLIAGGIILGVVLIVAVIIFMRHRSKAQALSRAIVDAEDALMETNQVIENQHQRASDNNFTVQRLDERIRVKSTEIGAMQRGRKGGKGAKRAKK